MKYIYYGAGPYARAHFEELQQQYEPLCFCDRAARPGQTLFGLPVLPPSTLTSTHADAPILITRNPYFKDETQNYLIEEVGASRERIAYYEEFELVPTCYHLENDLYFDRNSAWLCCSAFGQNKSPRVIFSETDSPREKALALQELRKRVKTALAKGTPCECDGCVALETRRARIIPKQLTFVEFRFNASCNIRCIYCSVWHRKNENIDVQAYQAMIEEMKKAGIVDQYTTMSWAMGEIAISPQRAEILSVMSEFNSVIVSNCTIYDEHVAKHMASGKSYICCSLDSGTRETYAKIKSADLFEQVCCNLKRFSEIGIVDLKYILPGINDNEADVDGFIKLIDDILQVCKHFSSVILSRDHHTHMSPFSDQCLAMMARLTAAMETRCISVIICMLTDDEKNGYLHKLEELKTVDGFKYRGKK